MNDKSTYEQLIKFEKDYIQNIVKRKYCINENENSLEDVFNRQKRVLLENYENEKIHIERIVEMFCAGRYIPAGSILFGLGNTETKCSLSNCYFIPILEDSIEGIFDAIKEIGRTYSYRGGIGTDVSILRAKNDTVRNSAKRSSGSVSFMPLFSNATTTLGQCIAQGEKILTQRGLINIENAIKNYDHVWTRKGWVKITDVFQNGIKNVHKITTKFGYSLKCTLDHKILCFNGIDLVEKDVNSILPSDEVVILPGQSDKNQTNVQLKQTVYQKDSYNNSNRLNQNVILPTEMNGQLAYFLGYYFGDGCTSKQKNGKNLTISMACSNDYPQIKNLLSHICEKQFNIYLRETTGTGNLTRNYFNNRIICEWLDDNQLLKQKSAEIEFPLAIMESSNSVQLAFIAGFFDADGNCTNPKRNGYRFASQSLSFLQDIQKILLANNILCKIKFESANIKHNRPNGIYKLAISGKHSRYNFVEIMKKKSIKITQLPNPFVGTRDNYKTPYTAKNLNIPYNRYKFIDGVNRLTIGTYEKYRQLSNRTDLAYPMVTDKIVKIEKCESCQTYDLNLESEHLFWCNGFYVHNSGRRGALLITIDVRHPDTLDFIWAKARPEQVFGVDALTGKTADISGANISVKVTDDFMKAVNEDKDWTFIFPEIHCNQYSEWDGDYDKWLSKGYPVKEYKTVKARYILRQIAEASWMKADPGLQFWGNMINWSDNNFDTKLSPRCTNACGEQPLTDYGNCLLSALVLHRYVKNPYTNFAEFDNDLFLEDVHHGIRFLDMMIDLNRHPLPEQTKIDQYSRRVGQEFTGLGDLLAMMGLEYGSDESCEFIDGILYSKAVEELKTTLQLAKEKGCAPCLNTKTSRKKYLEQPYIKRIFDRMFPNQRKILTDEVMEYGLRNVSLNTVGPCGSLSIASGDCTTGIEPLFEVRYSRKTRVEGAEYAEVVHYPILQHADSSILNMSDEQIKKKYCYKSAYDLNFNDRIKLQSTVQKWTGASVSSTLNLRNDCTIEDIYNIYLKAYQSGLKGVTVYRDGCKEGVLSAKTGQTDSPDLDGRQRAYRDVQYWKGVKVYIVVTVDDKERPLEVFASIPHEAGIDEHTGQYSVAMFNERLGYWTSICRLVSISLRAGIPLEEVIRHLDKSCPAMTELPNILTRVLQKYLNTSEEVQMEIREGRQKGQLCTVCKEYGVIHTGGCKQCLFCGNTICG